MKQAARAYEQRYPEWYFNPYDPAVEAWCNARAAAFVVEVTETQFEALNAVVTKAAVLENMSVDELSRAIRPMVGLYHQQAVANWNYYTNLLEHGVSQKRAKDLAIRYAARQHRYRAYNIARTELAFAYNQGSYQATKQAQANGYMGEVEKVWCTADDERVCTICGGLDGKRIAMDDNFNFNTKLATPANPTIRKVPPAHPSCRCAVMYEEISPPDISQFLNR
jgi:SPP1 gp7 family putative phage head morphogenesis protein